MDLERFADREIAQEALARGYVEEAALAAAAAEAPGDRIGPLLVRGRLLTPQQFVAIVETIQAAKTSPAVDSSTLAEPVADRTRDPAAGQRIGPYSIEGVLGRGGMGTVFLATRDDGERVALKILTPAGHRDERAVRRFEREGRVLGQLDHPNILRVLDVGEVDGLPYIASQYLEGQTIEAVFARRRLAPGRALRLIEILARALEHAHRLGVVHRDVKPANLLLGPDGQLRLLDFGLARLLGPPGDTITRTGAILGTPFYMSPEQCRAEKGIDHRTDVYSTGVILYEALTGRRPFEARTLEEMVRQILEATPAPPSRLDPALPSAVDAICARALARDREDRYPSAADLAAACRRIRKQLEQRDLLLGQAAIRAGWIELDDLEDALETGRRSGRSLGSILIERGDLTPQQLRELVALTGL